MVNSIHVYDVKKGKLYHIFDIGADYMIDSIHGNQIYVRKPVKPRYNDDEYVWGTLGFTGNEPVFNEIQDIK